MVYKRKDFTGFECELFSYTVEFVFLRNIPITVAIWKNTILVSRIIDIGHLFYGKEV
jgi:hypothetical protein